MTRVMRRVPGSGEDLMAYVVLAIGALMVVAGIYAIVTGYPIVQVEQGWTSVIAGATLVAGGVVTVALALILRALQQLKGATAISLPRPSAAATDRAEDAVARAEPPHSLSPSPSTADETRSFAETALAPEPVPPIAPDPAHVTEEVPAAEPARLFGEEALLDDPSEVPAPEVHRPPALEPPPAAPEPPAAAPAVETKGAPHAAPPTEGPAAPPMEDWLDRAFADLDRDLPPTKTHVEPPREPAPEPAPQDPVMPESAEAMAVHPAATEPPVPAAVTTSAVIGHYEADGTSYVMYADGSIEAQSEAGIYRFASMAELKAFIES